MREWVSNFRFLGITIAKQFLCDVIKHIHSDKKSTETVLLKESCKGNIHLVNFWKKQKTFSLWASQTGMCGAQPKKGRLCSRGLKLPTTSLVHIYQPSVILMRCMHRQHLLQPLPVHPAACLAKHTKISAAVTPKGCTTKGVLPTKIQFRIVK